MKKLLVLPGFLLLATAVLVPGGFVSALPFSETIYINTSYAQDINQTSATLKGSVNPRNLQTKVWFEWGPSSSGLIYATSPQTVGSRNAYIDFLAGVGNLSADSVYFYRAVVKNSNGVFYGSTMSFKTKAVAVSGSTSGGGIFGNQPAKTVGVPPALLAVTLSSDKTKVDRNEEFVLTAKYQNIGGSDADNVVLKIELPKEMDLQMAAPYCYSLDRGALVFNLGRVDKDSGGEINVQVKTNDSARFGKSLEPSASMSFTDALYLSKEKTSDTLVISVVEKDETSMPASVGIFAGHYQAWFLVSLFANLFLSFYIFVNYRKKSKDLKI